MLVRTQVLFEEEDLKDIKLMAYARGVSMSEFLRVETRNKILKKKRMNKLSGVDALKLMARNSYKGSVPKDLSTNDDYLYEKL